MIKHLLLMLVNIAFSFAARISLVSNKFVKYYKSIRENSKDFSCLRNPLYVCRDKTQG